MTEQQCESKEFLGKLQAQDHESFRELVQCYHKRLLALATSITGQELAEEAVQEAWAAIYKGLPGFESRSRLKTWLFTIVRNECTRQLKKAGRVQTFSLEETDASDIYQHHFADDGHWSTPPPYWHINSPDGLLQEEQLRRCIEHTLKLLKPDQLKVFRLRELEQLSMDEVCNILELSHSNVRVLLHRARLTLLEVIDHYQETGEC